MAEYEISIEDYKEDGIWSKGKTISIDGRKVYARTRSSGLYKGLQWRCRDYGSVNRFEDFQHFTEFNQSLEHRMSKEPNGKFWQLDKDLNLYGDRSYSEDNCLFVTNELNSLFTNMSVNNGLPLGVCYIDRTNNGLWKGLVKPYRANCKDRSSGRKTVYLDYCETALEAHLVWIDFKLKLLKTKIDKEIYKKHAKLNNFVDMWVSEFENCLSCQREFVRTNYLNKPLDNSRNL